MTAVAMRPYWIDDATLQGMSEIVNRACWVEAVPHMTQTAHLVRKRVMHEKFRRAVLRAQVNAAGPQGEKA